MQYAEIVTAWAGFIAAFYSAGPTAQKRFESNYGRVPKKIEGARQ